MLLWFSHLIINTALNKVIPKTPLKEYIINTDALCKYTLRNNMPPDLAFDSLGEDEFQCLLFVMLKPVG